MSGVRVVYVGNLPSDVRESEVDDVFVKYGRIASIDIKAGTYVGQPAYCFVEFEHPDDAYDSVKGLDGRDVFGQRIRVELSRGGGKRGPGGYDGGYGRGGYDDRRGGGRYEDRGAGARRFGETRRTDHRVVVTGLPVTASWQDLKDHMRKGGEVTFAQVMRDGSGLVGLVDFATADDMDRAIRKLDDTEFRNPYDKSYIRVKVDARARRSRSRSPARRRSRSPGRNRRGSPPRSRSRSPGRGRRASPARSKSRSPGRGRSVSPARSRSRSAGRERSASPARSRGRSVGRERSASPARSKSRSAGRERSASPARSKSRSPRE